MDHNIQHNPDVGRAERIWADTVGLDKLRLDIEPFDCLGHRITSLGMTHRHDSAVLFSKSDDFPAFSDIGRQRFFDQYRNLFLDKYLRQLQMRHRWSRDCYGIDLVHNLCAISRGQTVILIGQTLSFVGVDIDHGNKFALR